MVSDEATSLSGAVNLYPLGPCAKAPLPALAMQVDGLIRVLFKPTQMLFYDLVQD